MAKGVYMPQKSKLVDAKKNASTKVTADYGGRRETLDRRNKPVPIGHAERRSGKERRSGFDRRSSLPPEEEGCELKPNPPHPGCLLEEE
jgi:hypothetical protein